MAEKVKKPTREKTIFNHVVGTKGALMDDVFINNPGVGFDPKELRTATGCKLSHCISHIRQLVLRGFVSRGEKGKFYYIPTEETSSPEIVLPEIVQEKETEMEDNEPENVVEGVMASEEERIKLGFAPSPTHLYSIEKQPEDEEEDESKDEEE